MEEARGGDGVIWGSSNVRALDLVLDYFVIWGLRSVYGISKKKIFTSAVRFSF